MPNKPKVKCECKTNHWGSASVAGKGQQNIIMNNPKEGKECCEKCSGVSIKQWNNTCSFCPCHSPTQTGTEECVACEIVKVRGKEGGGNHTCSPQEGTELEKKVKDWLDQGIAREWPEVVEFINSILESDRASLISAIEGMSSVEFVKHAEKIKKQLERETEQGVVSWDFVAGRMMVLFKEIYLALLRGEKKDGD